jgi:type I restriction enzyme S subunit
MTQKFKETEIGKIPEDWEVSEVGNLVNHKKGFAFKSEWYKDEGVRIIKVSNLTNDSISFKNCTYIDEELAKEYEEYELRPNDIIIATVGSWPNNPDSIVGKVIRVPKSITKELLNQNAVRLRVKDAEASSQSFLYYRLKYKDFSDYIVSGAQGSANQASITLKDIFNFNLGFLVLKNKKGLSIF